MPFRKQEIVQSIGMKDKVMNKRKRMTKLSDRIEVVLFKYKL